MDGLPKIPRHFKKVSNKKDLIKTDIMQEEENFLKNKANIFSDKI